MLVEIEAGRVGIVITKDLSRLGRNSALTGLYTNFTFPQYGVRYIAINDNYDTIDPNSVNLSLIHISAQPPHEQGNYVQNRGHLCPFSGRDAHDGLGVRAHHCGAVLFLSLIHI